MTSPLPRFASSLLLALLVPACADSHTMVVDDPLPPPSDAFCSEGGFCWHAPRPQGNAFLAADAFAPDAFVVVGDHGLVAFTDGTSLVQIETGTTDTMIDVWMDSPRSAWIVGREGLHRWTGGERTTPVDVAALEPLGAIDGVAPDAMWLGARGSLLAWDGEAFAPVAMPPALHRDASVIDVLRVSRDEGWMLVADGPFSVEPVHVIFHWDGATWTESARALGPSYSWSIFDLSRTADGTIWAAGNSVHRFDGTSWIMVDGATGLGGVWGTGTDLLWSAEGPIAGAAIPAPEGEISYRAIAGVSSDALLLAGDAGAITFFDGDRWTSIGAQRFVAPIDAEWGGVPPALFAGPWAIGAWGASASDLFRITGPSRAGNTIERRVGSEWVEDLRAGFLRVIDGSAPDDVWACGGLTLAHRGASGTWAQIDAGGASVDDVWSAGAGRAWAVGSDAEGRGVAMRVEGDAVVERFALPGTPTAVGGSGDDDVWVATAVHDRVEQDTILHHFDGTAFSEVDRIEGTVTTDIDAEAGVLRLLGGSIVREWTAETGWTAFETGMATWDAGYLWRADDGALWVGRSGEQAVVRR